MTLGTVGILLAAGAAAFLLTGLAMLYSRHHGLIDRPGRRSSHRMATPRGGGAGIVLAVLLGVGMLSFAGSISTGAVAWCALVAFTGVAAVGALDDHRPLSPFLRLAMQGAAAVAVMACIAGRGGDGIGLDGWACFAAACLFIVWLTNLYNFMDGSNGMAGAQGVFAGFLIAWLLWRGGAEGDALIALTLALSCAGFLPWNLGRARVFMGDVGSTSLGFVVAVLLVLGWSRGAFSVPTGLLVIMVFVMDTTLTLIGRVIRRERWYNAHKQHVYQRLIGHGWSHGRVLLIYQSINLLLIAPAVAIANETPDFDWQIALVITLILGVAWLLARFRFGEHSHERQ